jgi:hypothetical protein
MAMPWCPPSGYCAWVLSSGVSDCSNEVTKAARLLFEGGFGGGADEGTAVFFGRVFESG